MKNFKIEYFNDNSGFLRKNGGFEAQDHIYLKGKKLGGIRDPIANGEAVNKKYVDNEIKKLGAEDETIKNKIRELKREDGARKSETDRIRMLFNEKIKEDTLNKLEDGINYKSKANMDLNTFRVFNVPEPQREDEITNKKYIDDKANVLTNETKTEITKVKTELEKNQAFNTRNGKTFNAKGDLNMKQKAIRNIETPTQENDAVKKGYVDDINEFFKGEIEELKTADEENKKYIDDEIKKVNEKHWEIQVLFRRVVNNSFNRLETEINAGKDSVQQLREIFNNKIKKLEETDEVGRQETGQIRKLFNDKIIELQLADEETKKDITKLRAFFTDDIKTLVNLGAEKYEVKKDADMKNFKIVNLGNPSNLQDATNKKYIDERTPFIKENGYYQSTAGLNMGFNKINNLPVPLLDNEAVNKRYVDYTLRDIVKQETEKGIKTVEEEIKTVEEKSQQLINEQLQGIEQFKTFMNDKIEKIKEDISNVLTKERIFKFLGTSIILIRGEAEGPIIGRDAVLNSNRREPSLGSPEGFIAFDDEGNQIHPTIIYFGKFDGGLQPGEPRHEANIIKQRFLIPFEGRIFKYAAYFEQHKILNDEPKEFNLNLEIEHGYRVIEGRNEYRIVGGERKPVNEKHDLKILALDGRGYYVCNKILPPIDFKNCSSIYLSFKKSHLNIERFFITLVVQIHHPDYNEELLPFDL